MPSVTRHPTGQDSKCGTKGCPFTPDEHDEWMALCRQAPEHGHRDDQRSHQHFPKKGMGGHNKKSKIVVILCWPMHDRIDNGDWGNDVKHILGRGEVYFAWDLHGNTLIERDISGNPVLSAAAEGEGGPVGPPVKTPTSSAAAPSAGSKEESDGTDIPKAEGEAAAVLGGKAAPVEHPDVGDRRGLHGGDDGDGSPMQEVSPDSDSRRGGVLVGPLTHEQRVAKAQEIKDMEWGRQWIAGDTGNAWIAELGEEAEQYLSDFGYVQESLANILRVCAAIKPPYRNGNLRYSHHVVVYELPPEDQMLRLAECEAEGWSVAEFRRQVKGTKPRVKRWSRPELQERWDGFWAVREQENPEWDFGTFRDVAFAKFLDWLGEQG